MDVHNTEDPEILNDQLSKLKDRLKNTKALVTSGNKLTPEAQRILLNGAIEERKLIIHTNCNSSNMSRAKLQSYLYTKEDKKSIYSRTSDT